MMVESKFTTLSNDQLPKRARCKCSLRLNIYFFVSETTDTSNIPWIIPVPWWKHAKFEPSASGGGWGMDNKHKWDFQWSLSLRDGSWVKSSTSPSQPENLPAADPHALIHLPRSRGSHMHKRSAFHESDGWSHDFNPSNKLTQKESHATIKAGRIIALHNGDTKAQMR